MTDWNEENRITIVTAPSDPITVANVKTYAQVDYSTDDALIGTLATQAREWVELFTRRKLGEYQLDLRLDEFPAKGIELPFPPLVSVDGVYYIDADGIEQTVDTSAYRVDSIDMNRCVRIVEASGESWPTPLGTTNAVRVRFTCGWGTIPQTVLNAVYDYAKSLYDNSEPQIGKLELWLQPYVSHRWG